MRLTPLLCGGILAIFILYGALHSSFVSETDRISALYAIETADPLFYSPELNGSAWKDILSLLIQKRSDFFSAMQTHPSSNPKEQKIIKEIIAQPSATYPFEFLETIPIVAAAHENFIAHPNAKTAEILIESQKKAANEYERDAEDFVHLTSDAAQTFPYSVYLTIGSAMTIRTVRDDAVLIAKNGMALQNEVAKREQCLKFGYCLPPTAPVLPPNIPTSEQTPPPPYTVPLSLITPPHTLFTLGPYGATTECFGDQAEGRSRLWPMYLQISMYEGKLEALPVLANENFYWDVRNSIYTSETERVKLGITYDDQIATNFYMCNDNIYYPNILTLSYLQTVIQKEGAVVPAEKKILSGVPSDTVFPELLAQYSVKNNATTTERAQIIENKLVDYDLMLGKMVELFDDYSNFTIINNTSFPAITILGLRSNYSLLYLPFARSVWRLPEHPQFVLRDQPYPNSGRYITYEQALKGNIDVTEAHLYDTDILTLVLKNLGKENWRTNMAGVIFHLNLTTEL